MFWWTHLKWWIEKQSIQGIWGWSHTAHKEVKGYSFHYKMASWRGEVFEYTSNEFCTPKNWVLLKHSAPFSTHLIFHKKKKKFKMNSGTCDNRGVWTKRAIHSRGGEGLGIEGSQMGSFTLRELNTIPVEKHAGRFFAVASVCDLVEECTHMISCSLMNRGIKRFLHIWSRGNGWKCFPEDVKTPSSSNLNRCGITMHAGRLDMN